MFSFPSTLLGIAKISTQSKEDTSFQEQCSETRNNIKAWKRLIRNTIISSYEGWRPVAFLFFTDLSFSGIDETVRSVAIINYRILFISNQEEDEIFVCLYL